MYYYDQNHHESLLNKVLIKYSPENLADVLGRHVFLLSFNKPELPLFAVSFRVQMHPLPRFLFEFHVSIQFHVGIRRSFLHC